MSRKREISLVDESAPALYINDLSKSIYPQYDARMLFECLTQALSLDIALTTLSIFLIYITFFYQHFV